jgi:hypothetical protein
MDGCMDALQFAYCGMVQSLSTNRLLLLLGAQLMDGHYLSPHSEQQLDMCGAFSDGQLDQPTFFFSFWHATNPPPYLVAL